jgi:hypothetical protein
MKRILRRHPDRVAFCLVLAAISVPASGRAQGAWTPEVRAMAAYFDAMLPTLRSDVWYFLMALYSASAMRWR